MEKLVWKPIVLRAKEVVLEVTDRNGYPPTLRDTWYVLYEEGWFTPERVKRPTFKEEAQRVKNTYDELSTQTSRARREGWFPDFLDTTRSIEVPGFWDDAEDMREYSKDIFRLDHTEGQPMTLILGTEKRGHIERLKDWFSEPLGIPVVPLGGNPSQTLVDDIKRYIQEQGRKTILIYAGDLDPSGEDIERDFVQRVGLFDEVHRVALTVDQLYANDYLMFPGNPNGHKANQFKAKYRAMLEFLAADHPVTDKIRELDGLFQVEINAMEDDELRTLFQERIDDFWDDEAFAAVGAREDVERDRL